MDILLKKLDDGLFPDHPLYCDGMPRPAGHGLLHLLYALFLPWALRHLLHEANSVLLGQLAVCVYIGGNFFCCLVSALYHIGRWSPAWEITLQKLDYYGIAVCSAGINIPVSLLLLRPEGASLASLSLILCLWTCWHISQRRPAA